MTLPPNDLPPVAHGAFQNLDEIQRAAFVTRYNTAKRSMALMIALAILFPIQLFLLGKVLLGLLFWLTAGGFGIWYVVEWFLTPGRVHEYNEKVANDILASMAAPQENTAAADEEE